MGKRTSESYTNKTLNMAMHIEESGDGVEDLPHRYTEDGISERREHVKKFLSRRIPQTVIAKLLNVSRRTISDDVKHIRADSGVAIAAIKSNPQAANTDIGLTAMRLEGAAQAAMNDYELAKSATDKNNFLRTAITAENARSNLLINTGILPKAGEEIRIRQDINATFTAKLGENSPLKALEDPSSRRKVLAVAEKLLRISAAKNNIKKIDAEIIDITPINNQND